MATLKQKAPRGTRNVYVLIAITHCKGGAMADRRAGRSKDVGKAKRQERRDYGF